MQVYGISDVVEILLVLDCSTSFRETSMFRSASSYFILHAFLFSLPARKYRKSYMCYYHPGVGVGVCVGVAQMLKVLVKDIYMLMDHVDTSTLHVGGYWSEVLSCTIMTHLDDLEIKKQLCFWLQILIHYFSST